MDGTPRPRRAATRCTARGIEHTFLTSIVDPSGTVRVQYLGTRFDPEEFLGDLRSLIEEARRK